MKQFDLQGNVYDCTIEMIPLKKATYEDIQALNINLQTQLFVKDKENKELKSIIKEVREYIKENEKEYGSLENNEKIILGILDKGSDKK